jgi:predicted metal-dependent phosphotriesterase family hydrolase
LNSTSSAARIASPLVAAKASYDDHSNGEVRPAAGRMALECDYRFTTDSVVPALPPAPITQEQIDEMMIANPARYFSP